jgi:hypothetical protein
MNQRAHDLTMILRAILGTLPGTEGAAGAAMNQRAHALSVILHSVLRAILRLLPGATSIRIQASEAWAMFVITTASDQAVVALGQDLGLGASVIKSNEGRWWRYATSIFNGGSVRFELIGPHHMGSPPGSDANWNRDAE